MKCLTILENWLDKLIVMVMVNGVWHARQIQRQLFSKTGLRTHEISLTPIGTTFRSGYLALFLHVRNSVLVQEINFVVCVISIVAAILPVKKNTTKYHKLVTSTIPYIMTT
jgi:hypothetical protein